MGKNKKTSTNLRRAKNMIFGEGFKKEDIPALKEQAENPSVGRNVKRRLAAIIRNLENNQ